MIELLVSLWIALLGAERIDFFSGSGPFVLTPFLTLSPLLVIIGFFVAAHRQTERPWRFQIPERLIPFVLAVLAFLALNLISIIFGLDPILGAKRFILLALIIVYASAVFILLGRRPDPMATVINGAYLGIALYLVFCVLELANWLAGFGHGLPLVDLVPTTIGPYAPRLTGMSLDPNRGGMLLVLYIFLLVKFAAPGRLRSLALLTALVLLFLSLSKTALLAAAVMFVILSIQNPGWARRHWRTVVNIMIGLTAVTLLVLYLADIGGPDSPFNLEQVMAERLAMGKNRSGGMHLALMERGLAVWLSSLKNLTVGIGFGASYMVLGDFFPGNKYANFHCGYLSVLVEAGLGALLVFLFAYFHPVFSRPQYRPLIGAIAVFNLFYQLTLDPFFWLALLLFWNNFGFDRDRWKAGGT